MGFVIKWGEPYPIFVQPSLQGFRDGKPFTPCLTRKYENEKITAPNNGQLQWVGPPC